MVKYATSSSYDRGLRGERKHSIHRILISRLVLEAICISVALMAGVIFIEFRNINDRVAAQVVPAAELFRYAIMDNLDSPGLGDHARIRNIIGRYPLRKKRPADGHFVFARILDADFHEVARYTDFSYEHINDVKDYLLKTADNATPMQRGVWTRTARVGSAAVVHMRYELKNSADIRAGYIEGIYAISPVFLRKARLSAVYTALIATGIVLLTTLILYPSINRLMRNILSLSAGLLHANLEILNVLGSAIAKRDNDTDIHNFRVTIYAARIAEEMHLGEDEIRTLTKGAFLHDVGKIGISDTILLKPEQLSEEECEEMKKHVGHGLDIVKRTEWIHDAALVVGNHHEHYDGTGYPNGMSSTEIPLVARIFTIADVFDALTSKRPYKEALGFDETIEILKRDRGKMFDPEILDVFMKIAASLYETYANRDDDKPRDDLRRIGEHYFAPSLVEKSSLVTKDVL
ncbi:MAG: HD-GYP domain-containing protein [Desulfomonilia bacterium]